MPLFLAQLLGQTLGVLAEGERMPATGQRELSVEELKFVRATTGAFLNASLKFGAPVPFCDRAHRTR